MTERRTETSPLRGRRFGAYILEEELGRGGMAVVYLARRVDGAFAEEVAVKVLGTGLLSTSALAGFHREQQLLARLRHPRIATLLDGGTADDGTPFLVMERIVGEPIDRYCDGHGLDVRRRVDLLIEVCEGVAYAHRNLVVHRDLKPGNILVDSRGEAKLLDFGIAKLLATEGGPTEATLREERALTPGFAAPEQIAGRAVTTATDVFGLGKVLERLLADRQVDRDLANIRARALHPDPERRYVDARALSEDLSRWRSGRPVRATPDNWGYRLRKWAVRRRGAVAAGALVLLLGAAGVAATLANAADARRAQREASAVRDFLVRLFEAGDPAENRGRDWTVRELLERGVAETQRLEGEPLLRARLLEAFGSVHSGLTQYDRSVEQWREVIAILEAQPDPPERRLADLRDSLGVDLTQLNRLDEAEKELAAALTSRRRLFGDRHEAVAESLNHLGVLVGLIRGDCEAAVPLLRESVTIRRALQPAAPLEVATSLNDFGRCLSRLRRSEEAEPALREALALHRAALGDLHPFVADDLNGLGNALSRAGRPDEAEPLQREALALRRKLFGDRHADVAQNLNSLGVALDESGKIDQAAPVLRDALSLYRELFGDEHISLSITANNLGNVLMQLGEPLEAERLYRATLASTRGTALAAERERVRARIGLGAALRDQGRTSEAETTLLEGLEQAVRIPGDRFWLARAELELGQLELARGQLESAGRRFETAVELQREMLGADSVRCARATAWLGACRARQGRAGEAETLLRSALEILRRKLPPEHPDIVRPERELQRLAAA